MNLHVKWRKISVLAVVLVVMGFTSATAHNLWVVANPEGTAKGTVHMYFEHHVGPGDGTYNDPILQRGETWLRAPDGGSEAVAMKEVAQGGLKYFKGGIDAASASYAVDHTSLFGIYKGQLDFFHGSCLVIEDPGDLAALADSPHLPVRIVPQWEEGGLLLRIMYFQTPSPDATLVVFDKTSGEQKFIADAKGEVHLPIDAPGRYHMAAWVFEHDAAGAFENEAYKGLMHGTTLTIDIKKLPEGR